MEALNHGLFLLLNASAQPPAAILLLATILALWLSAGVPLLLAGLRWQGSRPYRAAALGLALLAGCASPPPVVGRPGLDDYIVAHASELATAAVAGK